jgi:carbonic anhydrase/acetyltransferase-like protein (isoleucine patch superfamily)
MLLEYRGKRPRTGDRVFIAEGAKIVGDVQIGDHSSVWFNAVVRGDVDYIRIGKHTNVQDGAVLHGMKDQYPVVVGDYVTIGHGAILHGCTIESHCLIGMGSTILNNAKIGAYSIIAAGTLVTEGANIPERSLVMGAPGKVKRALTEAEIASIDEYARRYFSYKENYLEALTQPSPEGRRS